MTQYVTNASKKKPMRLQVHAYDIIDVNIDKETPCPIAFAQFKCHLIENLHSFISISKYLLRCVNLQNWLWLKPLDKIHEIEIRYLRKKVILADSFETPKTIEIIFLELDLFQFTVFISDVLVVE